MGRRERHSSRFVILHLVQVNEAKRRQEAAEKRRQEEESRKQRKQQQKQKDASSHQPNLGPKPLPMQTPASEPVRP